jgi:hypothetical protein
MSIDQASVYGDVSSGLPSRSVENAQKVARLDNYGGLYTQPVFPGHHALALEGSLFELHEATRDASTTVAGHAAPVLADIDATFVKALFFLRNKDASTSAKRIHLLRLEVRVVTAGATGSNKYWADELDTGATRFSSGGEDLAMINCNMQSTNSLADVLTAKAGAVVVAAETSSVRKLGFEQARASIEVAGDLDVFVYGDTTVEPAAAAAAAVRTQIIRRPPVILGPSDSYMLGFAAASQNAAGVYKIRALVAYR